MTIEWKINPAAPDMSSSDDDWNALAHAGRIKPERALTDPEQVLAVLEATDLLLSFFEALRKTNIRTEC
jgi:hypothetical protein